MSRKFIIATQKNVELAGKILVNFDDLVEITIENEDDLLEYIDDAELDLETEEAEDLVTNIRSALKFGQVVHIIPISERDNGVINYLAENHGLADVEWEGFDVEILQDDSY